MSTALSIENLTKTYGNGFNALKGISLSVKQGDFFALLGPNGAGKSTTLGIVSSLVNKTSGKVQVFGYDIDTDTYAAKRMMGIVPQEFNFNVFEKVHDIIIQQAGYYGIPRALAKQRTSELLKQLGLWPQHNQTARTLSGGMKRRLMIARALVHQPKLLILDEPTAGVDIELRRSMWDFLQQINAQGTTIILTTHYLEEAESLCKNIAIIDKGHLIENTSMQTLLRKLNTETFLFDLEDSLDNQQKAAIQKITSYQIGVLNDQQLQITINREQNLNEVYHDLSQQAIKVMSMRNKTNRLEELFVGMVQKNATQTLQGVSA